MFGVRVLLTFALLGQVSSGRLPENWEINEILMDGDMPDQVDPAKIRFVWRTVQEVVGIRKMPPPALWFARFGNLNPPQWKRIWIEQHPEFAAEVQTKHYMAYSFPGINNIQVAPTIFTGIYGAVGLGYYVTGHEMMHYLVDGLVPVAEQHCYFKNKEYNKRLIAALVTAEIAHPILARPSRFTIGEGCE